MPMWFLMCIVVFVLFLIILGVVLLRGVRAVNNKLKETESGRQDTDSHQSANTRWARGDTQAAPTTPKKKAAMVACPACGGENVVGGKVCGYCGSKL